jgi:malate dehydrogenase (oxaloacetate-decarboxylating)
MSLKDEALRHHSEFRGEIETGSRFPVRDDYILGLVYLPGAAEPAKKIMKDPDAVFSLTVRGNLVAVVSDGSAVLGLGNIGPRAAMPVMEGKAVLFKTFGGVDAFPLCIDSQDPDVIVEMVKRVAPTLGGVNLEDISAPRCFEVERRLKAELDIPVFHDDQHGTAIVTLAALHNALRLTGRRIDRVRVVVNGAGAAGIAVSKLIMSEGIADLILCDRKGAIWEGRGEDMNPFKEEMSKVTNRGKVKGPLAEALRGADVFIGLSVAGAVTPEMVRSMRPDPIIFAMANPTPEIMPDLAREAGAAVVATGRSDFPNQVNNVLAFPGLFRGALDVRARDITEGMKVAAAKAIADKVPADRLTPDFIIPRAMDFSVGPKVAAAVARVALKEGIARVKMTPAQVEKHAMELVYGL